MKTVSYPLKLAWILCLIWTGAAAAAKDQTSKKLKPAPLAELSISILNNRIQFKLTADGVPLNALLDTGATSTIFFHSEKLQAFRPKIDGEAVISFPAVGRSILGQRIKSVTIRAGNFEFTSRGGLLIKDEALVNTQLEAEYDVILGQDFFRNYTVEIDPGVKKLWLYTPGTDLSKYYNSKAKLNMEGHTPHLILYSQMPWEDHKTRKALLLDTGYPGSMVLWSKRHYRQATLQGQIVSRNENSQGIISHIKLIFGELTFNNIPVFIAKKVPDQLLKRDGLVGASLLAQYRHVIDFTRAQLLMTPVYGASGEPLQIIDGIVYTPNNEMFDVKTYYPDMPVFPTLIIHAGDDRGLQ